jgi:hypothetical protein
VRQTAHRSLTSRWGGRYCGADCPGATRRRRVRDFGKPTLRPLGRTADNQTESGRTATPLRRERRLAAEPGCPAPTRPYPDRGRHLARKRRAERFRGALVPPRKAKRRLAVSQRNLSARGPTYPPSNTGNREPGLGRRCLRQADDPAKPRVGDRRAPARMTLSAAAADFPLVQNGPYAAHQSGRSLSLGPGTAEALGVRSPPGPLVLAPAADDEVYLAAFRKHRQRSGLLGDHAAPLDDLRVGAADPSDPAIGAGDRLQRARQRLSPLTRVCELPRTSPPRAEDDSEFGMSAPSFVRPREG